MQQHGFIHDMLDVKVLILFVASKALYPLSLQKIYELCFQDDCLSYFDVSVAVPQMVESGHLEKTGEDEYVITDKGREQEEVTSDAIAYPVMQRALAAVERFNREIKRQSMVRLGLRATPWSETFVPPCAGPAVGVTARMTGSCTL